MTTVDENTARLKILIDDAKNIAALEVKSNELTTRDALGKKLIDLYNDIPLKGTILNTLTVTAAEVTEAAEAAPTVVVPSLDAGAFAFTASASAVANIATTAAKDATAVKTAYDAAKTAYDVAKVTEVAKNMIISSNTYVLLNNNSKAYTEYESAPGKPEYARVSEKAAKAVEVFLKTGRFFDSLAEVIKQNADNDAIKAAINIFLSTDGSKAGIDNLKTVLEKEAAEDRAILDTFLKYLKSQKPGPTDVNDATINTFLLTYKTLDQLYSKKVDALTDMVAEFEKGLNPARYRIMTAQDKDRGLWNTLKTIIGDFSEENLALKTRTLNFVDSLGELVASGTSCKLDKQRYIEQFNNLLKATPELEAYKMSIDCDAEEKAYKGEYKSIEDEKARLQETKSKLTLEQLEEEKALLNNELVTVTADKSSIDIEVNTLKELVKTQRDAAETAKTTAEADARSETSTKLNAEMASAQRVLKTTEDNLRIKLAEQLKLKQRIDKLGVDIIKIDAAIKQTTKSGGALKKEEIDVLKGFFKDLDDVKKLLRGMIETSESLKNDYKGFKNNVRPVSEIGSDEKEILGQSTYIDNEGAAFLKKFQETVATQEQNIGPIMNKVSKVLDFDQESRKFKNLRILLKELLEGSATYDAVKAVGGLGLTIEYKKLMDAVTTSFNKFRDDTKKAASGIREQREQALKEAQAKAQRVDVYGRPVLGGAPGDSGTTDPDIDAQLTQIQTDLKKIGTDVVDILDKFIKTSIEESSGASAATGAPGQQVPSIFNSIYRKYIDKREDNPELAAIELAETVRANHLDPKEVLAITTTDRTIFIFITLFIRLMALSIVEWMIEKGYILTVGKVLTFYLAIYTFIFLLMVVLVNFDIYRMRIVFNYVNFHTNAGRVLSHIAALWIFAGLVYMIMWNINIPLALTFEVSVLTEEDQVNLMYRIEMLSMIIWGIMTTVTIFI